MTGRGTTVIPNRLTATPNVTLSFRTYPCHSERTLVIPNGVRNLRCPSDGQPATTTTQRVSQHLRFFGVRASE